MGCKACAFGASIKPLRASRAINPKNFIQTSLKRNDSVNLAKVKYAVVLTHC